MFRRLGFVVVAAVVGALAGCFEANTPTSQGGESHFLGHCTRETDCGDTLACIGERCTLACDDDSVCIELRSDARCSTPQSATDTRTCEGVAPADQDAAAPTLDGSPQVSAVDTGKGPAVSVCGMPYNSISACVYAHCCTELSACNDHWLGCANDTECMYSCVLGDRSGNVSGCSLDCQITNPYAVSLEQCIDANCTNDQLLPFNP